MTLLDKAAILAAADIKTEDVDVPEWGGTVRVRTMSGTQRDAFGAALLGPDGKPDMSQYRAGMVAASVVGEDGVLLFSSEDVKALGAKSAKALDRVFAVADRLNGMSGDAIEAAKGN